MGVKISNLPAIVTPALSDIFPVVQSGVTYKESFTQLSSLFATAGANSNITSLSGLTTPLSVAQGGTGSATGDAIFASLTFNPTTSGIVGTPTNNNAAAGKVGEVVSSAILAGSAVSVTTATPRNLTSISLTAGDWNVFANMYLINTGTASLFQGGISTTSATMPDDSLCIINSSATFSFTGSFGGSMPSQRISLASTTTVYAVVNAVFNTGAVTACGAIYARRAR